MLDPARDLFGRELEPGVARMALLPAAFASGRCVLAARRPGGQIARRRARGVPRVLSHSCLGFRQLSLQLDHPGLQQR
jgi:hypothetical protein